MIDHDLTDREAMFLENALAEFPYQPSAHETNCARDLARCFAAWVAQHDLLRIEGTVIDGQLNPRFAVVRDLGRRVLAWRRSLGIDARSLHGETRDVGRRREIAKRAETNSPMTDDLLSKPKC